MSLCHDLLGTMLSQQAPRSVTGGDSTVIGSCIQADAALRLGKAQIRAAWGGVIANFASAMIALTAAGIAFFSARRESRERKNHQEKKFYLIRQAFKADLANRVNALTTLEHSNQPGLQDWLIENVRRVADLLSEDIMPNLNQSSVETYLALEAVDMNTLRSINSFSHDFVYLLNENISAKDSSDSHVFMTLFIHLLEQLISKYNKVIEKIESIPAQKNWISRITNNMKSSLR